MLILVLLARRPCHKAEETMTQTGNAIEDSLEVKEDFKAKDPYC